MSFSLCHSINVSCWNVSPWLADLQSRRDPPRATLSPEARQELQMEHTSAQNLREFCSHPHNTTNSFCFRTTSTINSFHRRTLAGSNLSRSAIRSYSNCSLPAQPWLNYVQSDTAHELDTAFTCCRVTDASLVAVVGLCRWCVVCDRSTPYMCANDDPKLCTRETE
jgi:hypothetical protein